MYQPYGDTPERDPFMRLVKDRLGLTA